MRYLASRHVITMSNKPYLINCRKEEVVECGTWLLRELKRFKLKYEESSS